MPRDTKFGFW